MLAVPTLLRAGSLPQGICGEDETWAQYTPLCGSELARDSGGSACISAECAAVIASKLAPTKSPSILRPGTV
ncbi:hypothetical protein EPZ47_13525 [Pseudomonas viciae]|uniref:Uncharacterized protein n=1 Tax=Pseudomonas viciae TaxID=2505979 RepID=A0A4P7PGP9_9PSED|nr:hypothetical protein EPZ47_13525 [Pseudomonas viciae]